MPVPDAEMSMPSLMTYIQERFLNAHRQELPELVRLAREVETRHANEVDAPHGLAAALQAIAPELEAHIDKEEAVVFPSLSKGEYGQMQDALAGLRRDHENHEAVANRIAAMTHGLRLPRNACTSWRKLYAGLGKLVEDLDEHRYLQDNVLFPRFETAVQSSGQEIAPR